MRYVFDFFGTPTGKVDEIEWYFFGMKLTLDIVGSFGSYRRKGAGNFEGCLSVTWRRMKAQGAE